MTQVKVGQVWITPIGNCWAIEQILDDNRAMVRRIAIRSEDGELHKPASELLSGPYCWRVDTMPGTAVDWQREQPGWLDSL